MISHGLLICSFFMKKKYSRTEDEILALNGSYEYDEVTYDNIFSLFSGFYDNYTELADALCVRIVVSERKKFLW